MIYVNIKEEDFKQIEESVCRNNVQYYYVRFNEVTTDGVVHAVEHELDHTPSTEDIQALQNEWLNMNKNWKKCVISGYAKSDNVKVFTINDMNTWLESEQRESIRYSVACEKKYGRENCVIVLNGISFTMPIVTAEDMLERLEIYAKDCFVATQQHLEAVTVCETVEEVNVYDHTAGYPEKLVFNV